MRSTFAMKYYILILCLLSLNWHRITSPFVDVSRWKDLSLGAFQATLGQVSINFLVNLLEIIIETCLRVEASFEVHILRK